MLSGGETFESPAPVPVADVPWLGELAVRNDVFGVILHGDETTLQSLRGAYLAGYDHLREAAVDIGEILMSKGYDASQDLVNIRSGKYDPRISIFSNIGYHFDINKERDGPAAVHVAGTVLGGKAAVGQIIVKDPEEILGVPLQEWELPRAQASVITMGETMFDVSQAEIVTLDPDVVYLLPPLSVHEAPEELGPYGRNFFRFKQTNV